MKQQIAMTGLLKTIYRFLELKKSLTIQEVYEIAADLNHKQSYAEKLMRRDKEITHPNVQKIYQDKPPYAVIGFKWVEEKQELVEVFKQKQLNLL